MSVHNITKNTPAIQKTNPWQRSRQAGYSVESIMFGLIIFALLIAGLMSIYSSLQNKARITNAFAQSNTILDADNSWGGNDKSGISMDVLCKGGYLTPEICGGTKTNIGNGATGNPWGGPYQLVTDANTSRVKLTLGNVDKDIVTSVGDSLAKLSFDNCKLVKGCATATASGTTVTITR